MKLSPTVGSVSSLGLHTFVALWFLSSCVIWSHYLCTSKQQSKNVLKDLGQRWKLMGIGVNLYLFWEQTAKMLRLSRTSAWLHATALHHIFWGPWSLADRGLNVYPSLCPSLPTLLQYSCQVDLHMSFVVVCLFLFSIVSFTFEISPFPFP